MRCVILESYICFHDALRAIVMILIQYIGINFVITDTCVTLQSGTAFASCVIVVRSAILVDAFTNRTTNGILIAFSPTWKT